MKKRIFTASLLAIAIIMIGLSCKKTDTTSSTTTSTTSATTASSTTSTTGSTTSGVPDVYKKVYGATSIYLEGDSMVVFTTVDTPDHKTPYYKGTQWESRKYEADTNSGFHVNPSVIEEQLITFKIPLHPKQATTSQQTPLGPMGISLNGVPFFNQYAAGRAVLTTEKVSFDEYGGHPQMQGQYHYHVEPTWLTKNKGEDALLGFLLDGFPVYGPMENGKTISNSDLDSYHGHTSATADYPNGIYHYHITSADPYINGSGFYGTPGTVK